MGTLLVVTLPIEIGFLGVLRGVGWLEIPFLFIGFYVLFFCVTVRTLSIASPCTGQLNPVPARFVFPTLIGRNLTLGRQVPHEFPLVQRIRPGHVCHAGTFRNDGPCRSIAPRGLLRARERNGGESPGSGKRSARPSSLNAFEKDPDEIRPSGHIALTPPSGQLSESHAFRILWGLDRRDLQRTRP